MPRGGTSHREAKDARRVGEFFFTALATCRPAKRVLSVPTAAVRPAVPPQGAAGAPAAPSRGVPQGPVPKRHAGGVGRPFAFACLLQARLLRGPPRHVQQRCAHTLLEGKGGWAIARTHTSLRRRCARHATMGGRSIGCALLCLSQAGMLWSPEFRFERQSRGASRG